MGGLSVRGSPLPLKPLPWPPRARASAKIVLPPLAFCPLRGPCLKSTTEYMWFDTKEHRQYVNITEDVRKVLRKSAIREGLILVSAMHTTAGVWVNDADGPLLDDIDVMLERLAPFREDYGHHHGGESNGDAHMKSLLVHHQVVVPVTKGDL